MQPLQYTKALSLLCALAFLVLGAQAMMRLCGDELPAALDKICVNGFNTKMKRSFVPPEYNELDYGAGEFGAFDDFGHANPMLSRMIGESAHQLMKTRRRRFGVSDECCRKPCTYAELFSYCR